MGFFITCPFIWIIWINEKLLNYDATIGLTMETMLVTPFAIIYLVMTGVHGFGSFGSISMLSTLLLIGRALLQHCHFLFCKRSPTYSALYGRVLQYIAPTISLILGVFVFGEHFTSTHMIAFFCIWVALVVFSVAKTKFLVQKQPKFIKINQQKYRNA